MEVLAESFLFGAWALFLSKLLQDIACCKKCQPYFLYIYYTLYNTIIDL